MCVDVKDKHYLEVSINASEYYARGIHHVKGVKPFYIHIFINYIKDNNN